MAKNPGVIKIVIAMHNQGCSVVAIAKSLCMSISEVVDIINCYK